MEAIKLLEELSKSFYTVQLEDRRNRVCFKNDKYQDLFRDIHGTEMLPDDFRYSKIRNLINSMLEYSAHIEGGEGLIVALLDFENEIIEREIPIYTFDKLHWLASNIHRVKFCDEAVSDGYCADNASLLERIDSGIQYELIYLYTNIINAVEKYVKQN